MCVRVQSPCHYYPFLGGDRKTWHKIKNGFHDINIMFNSFICLSHLLLIIIVNKPINAGTELIK